MVEFVSRERLLNLNEYCVGVFLAKLLLTMKPFVNEISVSVIDANANLLLGVYVSNMSISFFLMVAPSATSLLVSVSVGCSILAVHVHVNVPGRVVFDASNALSISITEFRLGEDAINVNTYCVLSILWNPVTVPFVTEISSF